MTLTTIPILVLIPTRTWGLSGSRPAVIYVGVWGGPEQARVQPRHRPSMRKIKKSGTATAVSMQFLFRSAVVFFPLLFHFFSCNFLTNAQNE